MNLLQLAIHLRKYLLEQRYKNPGKFHEEIISHSLSVLFVFALITYATPPSTLAYDGRIHETILHFNDIYAIL